MIDVHIYLWNAKRIWYKGRTQPKRKYKPTKTHSEIASNKVYLVYYQIVYEMNKLSAILFYFIA